MKKKLILAVLVFSAVSLSAETMVSGSIFYSPGFSFRTDRNTNPEVLTSASSFLGFGFHGNLVIRSGFGIAVNGSYGLIDRRTEESGRSFQEISPSGYYGQLIQGNTSFLIIFAPLTNRIFFFTIGLGPGLSFMKSEADGELRDFNYIGIAGVVDFGVHLSPMTYVNFGFKAVYDFYEDISGTGDPSVNIDRMELTPYLGFGLRFRYL